MTGAATDRDATPITVDITVRPLDSERPDLRERQLQAIVRFLRCAAARHAGQAQESELPPHHPSDLLGGP